MQRRQFNAGLALAISSALPAARAAGAATAAIAPWAAIESGVGGRLGVAVLDTGTGSIQGHRLDERFPMCSTFKWLAASLVLRRVDLGEERLDRRIRFGARDLVSYSPVSEKHVGGEGMTVADLCEAAVTVSDNGAANLLLRSFGGPPALTRHARSLGDTKTRLDRIEPALNEARPGDPRDTTTPRAMSVALRAAVLGDALSVAGRAQLARWLQATQTGNERLRAGLPKGWRVGDKTGTGGRGSTNDVAVVWPPDRAPLVIAAYLTQCTASVERRDAALAEVGRAAAALVG
jgi:beta-lactamase class A